MADVRETWEQRAREAGTKLSGVLFRGLSDHVNNSIHMWHTWIVTRAFAPLITENSRVLDLGCGYGRLSHALTSSRSDLQVVGQDVALEYCRHYRTAGDPCVCADAGNLPYARASFHAVMAVTCLMYVERHTMKKVLHEVGYLLPHGGVLLMLDPGAELQQLIAVVRGKKGQSPTGGAGFTLEEYISLVEEAGFKIEAKGGNPWLSMLLMLTAGKGQPSWRVLSSMLGWCQRRDSRPNGYRRFSLHRWIVATKLGRNDADP